MAESVGKKIKELRIAGGMTQAELAARLNVSDDLVGKWELGQRYPDYEMLCRMAGIFGVEPGALFCVDTMILRELGACIPVGTDRGAASARISDYVRTLDEGDRLIFLLRYTMFLDTKTVSAKTGKRDGTVRNRLVVLRRGLRKFLENSA